MRDGEEKMRDGRCIQTKPTNKTPLIKKFDFLRVRQFLVFVALKMY